MILAILNEIQTNGFNASNYPLKLLMDNYFSGN